MNLEKILLRFISLLNEKIYSKEIDPNINFNKYLDLGRGVLSGILQHLLEKSNWEPTNWIDDVLIRNISISSNLITIYGNTIYGKSGTTKEWVSPFLFQILLNNDWTNFMMYNWAFGEVNKELDYKDYHNAENNWNEYFDLNYLTFDSKWKYIGDNNNMSN